MPFYDLDWYIESRMRKTVKEIFDERGEEGFRIIEHNLLHEVAEFEDVIISCGGGVPCFYDNMEYMNQQGETVYLKATPEVLYGHLKMGKSVAQSATKMITSTTLRRAWKRKSPLCQSMFSLVK